MSARNTGLREPSMLLRDMILRRATTLRQLRTYARTSTARTLAMNIVIVGFGTITAIALARALGPIGRGQLAAALIWPTVIPYIVTFGHSSAALYYLAHERSESGFFCSVVLAAAWQSAIGIVLGYILLPLLLGHHESSIIGLSRWTLLTIPASLVGAYSAIALQAEQNFNRYNTLRALTPIAYFCAVGILILAHEVTVARLVACFVVLNFASATVGIVFVGQEIPGAFRAPSRRASALLMRYGARATVGDLSTLANFKIDQALIAVVLDARHLGIYVVAVSLAQVLLIVSTGIRTVIQPRLTAAQGNVGLIDAIERGYDIYARIAVPVLVGSAIAMPVVIRVVFGPRYSGALVPGEITLLATYFFGAKEISACVVQASGNPWLASKFDLFGAALTFTFLPLLVWMFGINGAATATLIAYAGQSVPLGMYIRRRYGIRLSPLLMGGAHPATART